MELQPWLMLTRALPRRLSRVHALSFAANSSKCFSRTNTRRTAIERNASLPLRRCFSSASRLFTSIKPDSSDSQRPDNLSHNVTQEEKDHYNKAADHGRARQIRTPWQREGSDTPPAEKDASEEAMSEGKILTTPSRMLKLILPLVGHREQTAGKEVEPLALVVHPQQPLSYLERLIQSEVPPLEDEKGREKPPAVYFRAQNIEEEGRNKKSETDDIETETDELESNTDGNAKSKASSSPGPIAKSSGDAAEFVRWSSSTEIGDFIRDAAPVKKFLIEIEGAPRNISVVVPTFEDRSHYLRMRLRKISKKISQLADIKRECDAAAHRGAQRVALGGFVALCGWWYTVYRLTFLTDLGWDVMEPVTYLVGLSTLIGGYVWFLTNNREVSYRSAMNFTISRKQAALYKARKLDLQQWETLIEEGNALRREIKAIANEYDVFWDESKDAHDQKVVEELKKKREQEKKRSKRDDEDEPR